MAAKKPAKKAPAKKGTPPAAKDGKKLPPWLNKKKK